MKLNPRQKKIVEAKENKIVCISGAGAGKALPNSISIPTLNGYKKVGDIKVGDMLYDRFGKPTEVLGVFPQGKLEVYLIEFSDGRTAVCSKDHLWYVHDINCKDKNKYEERTTEELLKSGLITHINEEEFYRWQIPCSKPVYKAKRKYNISPYVFGYLLGCEMNPKYDKNIPIPRNLSEEDCEEILNKITNQSSKSLSEIMTVYKKEKDKFDYFFSNKIPLFYREGAIIDRINFLRGLFDANCSISDNGEMEYTSTQKLFINDIKEMLGSLGVVSQINVKKDIFEENCYTLKIDAPQNKKETLLTLKSKLRKIKFYENTNIVNKNYDITSIKNIISLHWKEEMTCFYVDNPEHVFLTENYIVTHNTRVITERIKFLVSERKVDPSKIVVISFTNMAADELRLRLKDIAKEMFIGTLHSYACNQCLTNGINAYPIIQSENFDELLKQAITIPINNLNYVDYLFIDECQDLSPLEVQFIRRIPYKNIFLAGDPLQSIYQFKGCSPEFFNNLLKDDQYTKYSLIDNYRCAPNIIEFAENFVINQKEKGYPIQKAVKKSDGYIDQCSFKDGLIELENNGDWKNWAILTRSNAEADLVIDQLQKEEIPCLTFKQGELENNEELYRLLGEEKVKVLTMHSCLSGGTFVPTSRGVKRIADIVEEANKEVLIYNGEFFDEVENFIDNGIDLTYKVITDQGNSVRLTENHRCIIIRNGFFKVVKTEDLRSGDVFLRLKTDNNSNIIPLAPTVHEHVKVSNKQRKTWDKKRKFIEEKIDKDILDKYVLEFVISVEPYKMEKTYCLTMKKIPQFIQNGFLLGNSKGLEFNSVIAVGGKTYNEEECRLCYVTATRAEENLFWCPGLINPRQARNRKNQRADISYKRGSIQEINFE